MINAGFEPVDCGNIEKHLFFYKVDDTSAIQHPLSEMNDASKHW